MAVECVGCFDGTGGGKLGRRRRENPCLTCLTVECVLGDEVLARRPEDREALSTSLLFWGTSERKKGGMWVQANHGPR